MTNQKGFFGGRVEENGFHKLPGVPDYVSEYPTVVKLTSNSLYGQKPMVTTAIESIKVIESSLLTPPSKKGAQKAFNRIHKGVKWESYEQKFTAFKNYVDDLVKREMVTSKIAARWKEVNPWSARPGALE